jgi:hypothetical protein
MPEIIDLRNKAKLMPPPPPQSKVRVFVPQIKENPPVQAEPQSEPEPEIIDEEIQAEKADTISWLTSLHHVPKKEGTLYIGGCLFGAAILIAFFWHDLLFTTLLTLAGIILIAKSRNSHRPSQIDIDKAGISIDDQKYYYHEVKSFWLDYDPPHTRVLSIEFKKAHQMPLRIPLENTNPLEIRALMIEFIPEKEHERPMLDHFIRRLGL